MKFGDVAKLENDGLESLTACMLLAEADDRCRQLVQEMESLHSWGTNQFKETIDELAQTLLSHRVKSNNKKNEKGTTETNEGTSFNQTGSTGNSKKKTMRCFRCGCPDHKLTDAACKFTNDQMPEEKWWKNAKMEWHLCKDASFAQVQVQVDTKSDASVPPTVAAPAAVPPTPSGNTAAQFATANTQFTLEQLTFLRANGYVGNHYGCCHNYSKARGRDALCDTILLDNQSNISIFANEKFVQSGSI